MCRGNRSTRDLSQGAIFPGLSSDLAPGSSTCSGLRVKTSGNPKLRSLRQPLDENLAPQRSVREVTLYQNFVVLFRELRRALVRSNTCCHGLGRKLRRCHGGTRGLEGLTSIPLPPAAGRHPKKNWPKRRTQVASRHVGSGEIFMNWCSGCSVSNTRQKPQTEQQDSLARRTEQTKGGTCWRKGETKPVSPRCHM